MAALCRFFVRAVVNILKDKVVIQIDDTGYGIANDLLDAGIPKSDIVLGYYPPEKSRELGFAVVESAQA